MEKRKIDSTEKGDASGLSLPGLKSGREYLAKEINLLLDKGISKGLGKLIRVLNRLALSFSIIFTLTALFTFAYFWFLTSHSEALKKRADQAKVRIASFNKEERTYLNLLNKLTDLEKILEARPEMSQLLKETDSLFPDEVSLRSLSLQESGEANAELNCASLSCVETLNNRLRQALDEERTLSAQIKGLSKEADGGYRLSLTFKLKK